MFTKRKFIKPIIEYLGIDKENNPDKIKLNDLDTDREYQIKLAKELWNEKLTKEDKFWYPEDYYYIEDFMLQEKGFGLMETISYGNSDNTFLKFNEWRKKFRIYFNPLDRELLVFVDYERCMNKESCISESKHFIGIYSYK